MRERYIQSHNLPQDHVFGKKEFLQKLKDKIASLDFDQAKDDVRPFLQKTEILDLWSRDFFTELTSKLKYSA